MQVYLSVTPGQLREASQYGRSFAHVAYRIGEDSSLLRQSLLLQTQGGLLSVSDREAPLIQDPAKLSAAVLRECGRRGYTGVVLDFEEPPRQDRQLFAQRLEQSLTASRRTLYIPETYIRAAPGARMLLCTALSGGTFTQHLQEVADQHGGAARLALDIQRLRMDFQLPAPSGEGIPLSQETLETLMAEESPSVFFSQDLCARYFTYTRNGETHFVLYDDADTLSQKLRTGAAMGFSAAFFAFPEVRDLLPRLFPRKR